MSDKLVAEWMYLEAIAQHNQLKARYDAAVKVVTEARLISGGHHARNKNLHCLCALCDSVEAYDQAGKEAHESKARD